MDLAEWSCVFVLFLSAHSASYISIGLQSVGATWAETTPSGMVPEARRSHAVVVHGDEVFMFGGKGVVVVTQTLPTIDSVDCVDLDHCYDSGTCITNTSCSCDDGFYGERCEYKELSVFFSDFWSYNTVSGVWTPITSASASDPWPTEREHHTMFVLGDYLYLLGGYGRFCNDYCTDLWQYNLVNSSWIEMTESTPLGKRYGAKAASIGIKAYVFGGFDASLYHNSMWTFSKRLLDIGVHPWVELNVLGDVPCPRMDHAMAVSGTSIFMFGGYQYPNTSTSNCVPNVMSTYYLNDMWRFDTTLLRWVYLEPSTSFVQPRALAGLVAVEDVVLLFGGSSNQDYLSDMWRFNVSTLRWTMMNESITPAQRFGHSMSPFPGQSSTILFGGQTGTGDETYGDVIVGETWTFNGSSCPFDCLGRGWCKVGICVCEEGFFGELCQHEYCPGTECSHQHGTTEVADCAYCSGRGSCVNGACRCDPFYAGAACDVFFCFDDCSDNGVCVETSLGPQCVCDSGFYGETCASKNCPSSCSGHGTCDGLGTCICDETSEGLYIGADCSVFIENSAPLAHLSVPVILFALAVHIYSLAEEFSIPY